MKIIYTKEDKERHAEYGRQGAKKAFEVMTKKQRVARAKKASDAAALARLRTKKEEVAQ